MVKESNGPLNEVTPQLTINSGFTITKELAAIDYESQAEKEESENQVCWSNMMDKGNFSSSSCYKNVEVLMLRWAGGSDDLGVDQEVNDLKDVLENQFNFHVHVQSLENSLGPKLHSRINFIVSKFVHDCDGEDTLLIVYYAGHGGPGPEPGQLQVFGQSSPNDDEAKKRNRLIWNKTEQLLYPAVADILEIFDCCYAGTLGLTKGHQRSFEFLAATRATEVTPLPGPKSFTSALIYALKKLLKTKPKGRFTTSDLLTEIKNAPNFQKDEQHPEMFDREKGSHRPGRIMLNPLPKADQRQSTPARDDDRIDEARQYILTLHFDFAGKPSKEHVTELSSQLIALFERNTLKVNGIRYGGLNPSPAARAALRFQSILAKNRRKSSSDHEKTSGRLLVAPGYDLPTPSPEVEELNTEMEAVISSDDAAASVKKNAQTRSSKRRKRSRDSSAS